jgi:L-gulonate 3-dehydrogenase
MRTETHQDDPRSKIAAVIGAGNIGCSFAALLARAGWVVRLFDASPAGREHAIARTAAFLDQTGNGDLADLVSVHDDLAGAIDGVRWVQECTPEVLESKRAVFAELDRLCPDDVLLASSASALTMTEMSADLRGAGRCVVVHPTNPPHLLRFVEIVAGVETSPETVAQAKQVMESVGQYAAVIRREVPAFVLNRLQTALEREAFKLLSADVASVKDIDAALTEGLAPRWTAIGPFAVEETNAEDIGSALTKFRNYFNATFVALDEEPFEVVDDEFTALAVEGVRHAYGTGSRDGLVRKRDDFLLAWGVHAIGESPDEDLTACDGATLNSGNPDQDRPTR